ncbi:SURF1 family protein [Frigidibacter sp. SD6-1]|uniref:SURF1 family protein n=1 Tax=Frigidibacter sp. SD6-1 TaxID=3032581 RepID=UPI0024DF5633|nr:SURF1 family protein [Frigidibacter sp. SD6-1]
MRRLAFPLILGLVGVAILLSLGTWQLRRLAWKETVIADIEARITASPVELPPAPALDPERDRYLPVRVTGRTTGDEVRVLSGKKDIGGGYEIIATFETEDGRRILLDRGFVPEAGRDASRPPVALAVTGNLHWPAEADGYTPAPDPANRLWFARDVATMSENLKTEPVLVVLRTAEGDAQSIVPVPVDTSGIPNDHLNYAITWFSLAGVWVAMSGYLIWRTARTRDIGQTKA